MLNQTRNFKNEHEDVTNFSIDNNNINKDNNSNNNHKIIYTCNENNNKQDDGEYNFLIEATETTATTLPTTTTTTATTTAATAATTTTLIKNYENKAIIAGKAFAGVIDKLNNNCKHSDVMDSITHAISITKELINDICNDNNN
eukprot:Pgem_evm1s19302